MKPALKSLLSSQTIKGTITTTRRIQTILAALLALASSGMCASWDLASDWSGIYNPNGAWSYGRKWSAQIPGMDLLTVQWGDAGWYLGNVGDGSPSVSGGGPSMWAKYNANGYPCCRWTCPQKGNYSIVGWFVADATYGGNTFVYVVTNGSIMFSNHVASSQSSPPPADFTNSLASLNQGDLVDFTLAWDGENGGLYTGWTAVEAVITLLYPHAATATAVVTNGYFVGAPLTDPGYGYTNTPGVRIIGGGGTGAQAVAVVSNGLVTAVNIANPGSGYTTTPVIVIAPPFIPQPTMGITALSELSFANLTVGTNYQLQSIVEGNLSNVGSRFTATNSTFTQLVSGNASTNGYRLAATPVPGQAQATAQVAGGFVVGFTVTSGGSGYLPPPAAPPTVTISGIGGAGSNAVASASVSGGGTVTNISVVSPGSGFVNGATVVIAPPPATVLWPYSVSQVMELDLGGLSPYDNYQLKFTSLAAGTWNNLGAVFIPTSASTTQYINVTSSAGFFRAVYLP